jgi:hypothetical protein
MKHPANPQEKQHKSHVFRSSMATFFFSASFVLPGLFEYPYILLIAIISSAVLACIILTFLVRRRIGKRETVAEPSAQENLPKAKPKGLAVTKFELADNTVKFFIAKGFHKKRWVVVKEIPVYEITGIEHFGNELSVTWKGVTDSFFMKKNAESFGKLCDEVNIMLEEQRKTLENSEKASLRRNDLTGVINASIGIVDLSF